ncbi:MAG: hypothetical protein WBG19_10435 [Thermoplasmata archaeon]
MKVPFRWGFPVVAALATLVALAADTNQSIAIPAATCAVFAAALALWDAVRAREPIPTPAPAADLSASGGGSESWFHGGTMGQEAIVLLLDRIDRALAHPSLPARSARELTILRTLPRDEFLRYIESRIAQLEALS